MDIEFDEVTMRGLREKAAKIVLDELVSVTRQSINRAEFIREIRNEAVRRIVDQLSVKVSTAVGDDVIKRAAESVERRVNGQIHRMMQQGIKVSFDVTEGNQ